MFVEKLTISGFKSFYDRVDIRFGNGITAIVGPNGCGKSNIADAIRWVLGEQSTKQLRGEAMEDVIFNGTRDRKPLGLADVQLTVTNSRGILATEWGEVTVGRKLFRSGESEYSLNRTACRLRDVRDLFLDTGMGSHGYSVIEREMVDNILSDTTGHRRFLFEEAAGIMKYKLRKKEAVRKLEATEADLVRLNDIITEVDKEVRSLARQVGKARRHRRLLEEIRALDLALSHEKWRALSARREALAAEVAAASDRRAALSAEVAAKESAIEESRRQLLDRSREVNAAQAELENVSAKLAAADHAIQVLRERIAGFAATSKAAAEEAARHAERRGETERERERLASELEERRRILAGHEERLVCEEAELRTIEESSRRARDELARRRDALAQAEREETQARAAREKVDALIEESSRRLARADEEERELGARRDGLATRKGRHQESLRVLAEETAVGAAKLDAAGERQATEEGALEEVRGVQNELRERVASLRSRFELLEELRSRYEGYGEGVRAVMLGELGGAKAIGVVADLVTVPPDLMPAAGAAFGDAVQTVLVETTEGALRFVDGLAAKSLGPVTFFPLDAARPSPGTRHDLPRLLDRIGCEPRLRPALEALIGSVYLVSDRREAFDRARTGDGARYVTPAGEMVSGRGLVTGGAAGPGGALLSRIEETRAVAVELRAAEGSLAAAEARRAALEESLRDCSRAVETARAELEQCERRRQEEERVLSQLEFEDRLCREELEGVAAESSAATEESERLTAERASLARAEEAGSAARARIQAELETASEEESRLHAERDRRSAAVGDLRVAHATLSAEVRDLAARIERSASEGEAAAEAARRRTEEEREAREKIAAAEEETRALAAGLEGLHRDRSVREESRRALRETYEGEEAEIGERELALKTLRVELSGRLEDLHAKELQATEVRAELENLESRVFGEYEVRFDEAYAPPQPPPVRGEAAEAAEGEEAAPVSLVREERLRWLRERLGTLGPVNLLAIEDYDQKKERFEFLSSQRDDLTKAKESLREAILKINRTARAMFQETFAVIQENFTKTFSTLFEGGSAEIILTGDDALEADIDIVARPRGKKLESIRLMSSGERALTAIALLFAIYLVKPSPFCILDEVDAPLDDANIDRFVRMLKEFSRGTQFIVITHNKKTMEAANCLYGITMQEPGVSRVVSVRLDGRGGNGDSAGAEAREIAATI